MPSISYNSHGTVRIEAFAREIEALRTQSKWTRRQASDACGIDRSYWTLLERDGSVPGRRTLEKIVAAFIAAGAQRERAEALFLLGNYMPPRTAGLSDDERLHILRFIAASRAKRRAAMDALEARA